MFYKILTYLFKCEYIYGAGDSLHIVRWVLLSLFGYKCYLHNFVGDDTSRSPHDHPKRFLIIGLAGRYQEEVRLESGDLIIKEYIAPWIRRFSPSYTHRIFDCAGAWTLVVVSPAIRPWGFWEEGRWYSWRRYIAQKLIRARRENEKDWNETWSHTVEHRDLLADEVKELIN